MPIQHDNDNEPIPPYLLVLARIADALLALRDVEEIEQEHPIVLGQVLEI